MRTPARLAAIAVLVLGTFATTAAPSAQAGYGLVANPILRVDQNTLGNVFLVGQQASVHVTANADDVSFVVTDFSNNVVQQGTRPVGNGNGFEVFDLPLNPGGPGYYLLRITSHKLGVTLLNAATVFAVLTTKDFSTVTDSAFAVQTGMQDTDPLLVSLLAKAGVKTVRDYQLWQDVESSAGTYAFPARNDAYMAELAARKVNPLLILCYANTAYDQGNAPYSAAGITAFVNYAKAVLAHVGSQVKTVEVYNEYNLNGTGPAGMTAQSYVNMLRPTFNAVKAINPAISVTGASVITQAGGTAEQAQPDYAWLDAFFALGGLNYLDSLSLHLYPTYEPEGHGGTQVIPSMTAQIERVRDLMRTHNNGQTIPIIVTEIGWGSGVGDADGVASSATVGEDSQASYLVRGAVLALASEVSKVSWFMGYDQSPGLFKTQASHDYGLTRFAQSNRPQYGEEYLGNFTPHPSYVAYAVLARKLTGATHTSTDTLGTDIYSEHFQVAGHDVRVLWNSHAAVPVSIAASGPVVVTDMVGKTTTLTPVGGNVTITASPHPVYVEAA